MGDDKVDVQVYRGELEYMEKRKDVKKEKKIGERKELTWN